MIKIQLKPIWIMTHNIPMTMNIIARNVVKNVNIFKFLT